MDALAQMDLDYAVLGVDAFDPEFGAKALDEEEARVNQLMARQARTVVVVADSTKLTARAFARISPLADIDYFVTDTDASAGALDRIREGGVEVLAV